MNWRDAWDLPTAITLPVCAVCRGLRPIEFHAGFDEHLCWDCGLWLLQFEACTTPFRQGRRVLSTAAMRDWMQSGLNVVGFLRRDGCLSEAGLEDAMAKVLRVMHECPAGLRRAAEVVVRYD